MHPQHMEPRSKIFDIVSMTFECIAYGGSGTWLIPPWGNGEFEFFFTLSGYYLVV
jgi:hypothetical protein